MNAGRSQKTLTHQEGDNHQTIAAVKHQSTAPYHTFGKEQRKRSEKEERENCKINKPGIYDGTDANMLTK